MPFQFEENKAHLDNQDHPALMEGQVQMDNRDLEDHRGNGDNLEPQVDQVWMVSQVVMVAQAHVVVLDNQVREGHQEEWDHQVQEDRMDSQDSKDHEESQGLQDNLDRLERQGLMGSKDREVHLVKGENKEVGVGQEVLDDLEMLAGMVPLALMDSLVNGAPQDYLVLMVYQAHRVLRAIRVGQVHKGLQESRVRVAVLDRQDQMEGEGLMAGLVLLDHQETQALSENQVAEGSLVEEAAQDDQVLMVSQESGDQLAPEVSLVSQALLVNKGDLETEAGMVLLDHVDHLVTQVVWVP